MKRSTLNFAIDLVTFLVMIAMIATGLLVRFVLPPGSGERRSLWSYTRHDWGDVHFWLAVGLAALLVVHLALHWSWVCSVVQSWLPHGPPGRAKSALRRNMAGVALLVAVAGLIAAFLWVADRNVVERGGDGRQHRRGQRAALVTPPSPHPDAAGQALDVGFQPIS